LAAQLAQLVALLRRQAVVALAAVELVLPDPDPKRLRADAELAATSRIERPLTLTKPTASRRNSGGYGR
jgi:hypothetical protein